VARAAAVEGAAPTEPTPKVQPSQNLLRHRRQKHRYQIPGFSRRPTLRRFPTVRASLVNLKRTNRSLEAVEVTEAAEELLKLVRSFRLNSGYYIICFINLGFLVVTHLNQLTLSTFQLLNKDLTYFFILHLMNFHNSYFFLLCPTSI
jgi:hypothetical protein